METKQRKKLKSISSSKVASIFLNKKNFNVSGNITYVKSKSRGREDVRKDWTNNDQIGIV